MNRLNVLRQQKADLLTEADALAAKDSDGTITAEESVRYAAILDVELAKVNGQIDREEKLQAERRSMPAVAVVETAATLPAEAKATPEKFKSFGEQLAAVAWAGINPHAPSDRRLGRIVAAPTGANESIPSEGGFLVQTDFSTQMLALMHEQGEIISRVRKLPIGAQFNGIKFPVVDESSRVNGSRWGGVQGYWADEAGTVTSSKPKLRQMELSLKKLMAVGYATDELLADAAALETVMRTAFTEELTFKTEDAIVNGTGSGQPLGILNSGALVSVTPESGQAAATIRTENILKMWARTPIRSRKSLVWMINQDIEPQLWTLTNPPNGSTAGSATMLLYTPPTAGSPYGLLLGRPVIPTEFNATLGTVGDIVLWDPQQYVVIDKNGVEAAQSMHVSFLSAEQCFRFIYRLDGAPVERVAKTPFKGSATISPYVALATR
jgi:HK97 family phage major capsid protein